MAQITINVKTEGAMDTQSVTNALQSLADNIDMKNLILLGKKSSSKGINDRIRKYSALI